MDKSTFNEEVEIDGGVGADAVTDANGNRFNDELELKAVETFNPGNSFCNEIDMEGD